MDHDPVSSSIVSKDGVAMVRRDRAPFALIGLILLTFAGCDRLKQAIRPSDSQTAESRTAARPGLEPTAAETDASKIQAVDSDPKHPRSFFSNNRRSGTWSSEAREIESHLGVGP